MCVCTHMCIVCQCCNVCIDVRGQLVGVHSLFSTMWVLGTQIQVTKLIYKTFFKNGDWHLYPLSYLIVP